MTVFRRDYYNVTAPRTSRHPGEGFPPLPDWTADALCAQTGPDDAIWFPGKGGSQQTRDAKRLCAMCAVRTECLEYVMEFEAAYSGHYAPRFGVFGGLTPRQRRALARERESTQAAS